jgi:hypothetical protein
MGGKLHGIHRRVRDSHIGQTVYAQIRVDDASLFEREHGARGRRVEFGLDDPRDPVVPVSVSVDVRSGSKLPS